MNDNWDDDWDYNLLIRVKVDKTFSEFEKSISKILYPIKITNHTFSLGPIVCTIDTIEKQAPDYSGIPKEDYNFMISVPCVTYIIWGLIDKHFALAIVEGMRAKFECKYLVTADDDCFILYSGTNLPYYINTRYQPLGNSILSTLIQDKTVHKLNI
jgi:hypothetical protein